jgi:hypothetical protein
VSRFEFLVFSGSWSGLTLVAILSMAAAESVDPFFAVTRAFSHLQGTYRYLSFGQMIFASGEHETAHKHDVVPLPDIGQRTWILYRASPLFGFPAGDDELVLARMGLLLAASLCHTLGRRNAVEVECKRLRSRGADSLMPHAMMSFRARSPQAAF